MATKYYRSNNSDWNTDANWSTSSGGGADTTFPTAGDDAIFDDNSGNCTLDANAACDTLTIGTVGALYTGTLDAGSSDVAIGTGGLDCTHGGSATLDLGTGTWTCDGLWDIENIGTQTTGAGSHVVLTGTANLLPKSGVSLYDCTISGTYTMVSAVDILKVSNAAIVSGVLTGSGILNPDSVGVSLTVNGEVSVTSVIMRYGTLTIDSGATYSPGSTTTLRNVTLLNTGAAATLNGPVLFDVDQASRTLTFGAGTFTFADAVTFLCDQTAYTIANNTNNPDLIFQGAVTLTESAGTLNWTAGTGSITLSGAGDQDIDFDGKAVEDLIINKPVSGDVTMTGAVQTDSFLGTACV